MDSHKTNRINLSIIIVSYNTKDITLECIKSIVENTTGISYEIILIDNNSSDHTVETVQNSTLRLSSGREFKIIENKKNVGFSKANNQGIKQAKGRYILFLNSDTVVYKETLEGMLKFMDEHPRAGAATCFVELPNGELDESAHRGFPTPWNAIAHFSRLSTLFPKTSLLNGYSLSHLDLTKTHEIDACAGAFMIVRRDAGEEVGWWDEDYFWYGEDLDFCYRLKEKHWKVYFVPEFEILHYKGVSGGIKKISKHLSNATLDTQRKAIDDRFNAMRLFYNKHYTGKYPKLLTSLVLGGINAKWYLTKAIHRL